MEEILAGGGRGVLGKQQKAIPMYPELALWIGGRNCVDKALVLQQVHFWCKHNEYGKKDKVLIEGHYWAQQSYPAWQSKDFPFWSVTTVKRLFTGLESSGLLLSMQQRKPERDKLYRVDRDGLHDLAAAHGVKLTS